MDLSREEIGEVLDRAVMDLLESAEVAGPGVDAVALARHLGIEVKPDRRRANNPEEAPEELRQYQAAQAIGRHFLPILLDRLGIEPEGARGLAGSTLVGLFAERLLLPTRWFRTEAAGCGYDLEELHRRFDRVGLEQLAWRLLDLGEPCIITVIDNDAVAKRRSNAWPVDRHLTPAERECQRQVRRTSRAARTSRDGWTVQGWPVHRVDWRREILRSVRDSDEVISDQ